MKFTTDEAVKALAAKMTENGENLYLSERTIGAHVETLSRFVGDDVELNQFVDTYLPDFKTLEGQMRKDNSDFIKKWEKDHPAPQPAPKPQPKPEDKDEYTKQLEERLSALEAKNQEAEKGRKVAEKRSELVAAIKAKGVNDKEWIDGFLGEVSITEDMDVEAKAEAYVKIYNKAMSATGSGFTPKRSSGKQTNYKEMFSDIAKMRNHQNIQ